jgi:hypothetical protein
MERNRQAEGHRFIFLWMQGGLGNDGLTRRAIM